MGTNKNTEMSSHREIMRHLQPNYVYCIYSDDKSLRETVRSTAYQFNTGESSSHNIVYHNRTAEVKSPDGTTQECLELVPFTKEAHDKGLDKNWKEEVYTHGKA